MKKRRYATLFSGALLFYLVALPVDLSAIRLTRSDLTGIDTKAVASAVTPFVERNEFPSRITVTARGTEFQGRVSYTVDPQLQDELARIYGRYEPDYGSFVAIDPATGEILALTSFVKDGKELGNLALKATFPAASVFKIVTAAAVLDQNMMGPETVTPYNGKRSSLYKKQVFRHRENRWTRRPTLRKAFAQSVNTVFARLGVYDLGGELLGDYASRFAFNSTPESDLEFELGTTAIEADEWSWAETASGYTLSNTLSPIHGAMLAAAAVNNGRMIEPRVISMITDDFGVPLFTSEPRYRKAVSEDAARDLRTLMRETVRSGSARSAFRKFFRGPMRELEVGGKTGSLTGLEPKGRNDWFVGYADRGDKAIAFASLTVNKERWTIKSAVVARKVIEAYFDSEE